MKVHRLTTTIVAVLVTVVSTMPLAASASGCQLVVDPFKGTARCADAPQPGTQTTDPSYQWLWISLATLVLVAAAMAFMARRRHRRSLAPPDQGQAPQRFRWPWRVPARGRSSVGRHEHAPVQAELEGEFDNWTEFYANQLSDTKTRLAGLVTELQHQRRENERLRTELETLRSA